jgi:hypothetical protein
VPFRCACRRSRRGRATRVVHAREPRTSDHRGARCHECGIGVGVRLTQGASVPILPPAGPRALPPHAPRHLHPPRRSRRRVTDRPASRRDVPRRGAHRTAGRGSARGRDGGVRRTGVGRWSIHRVACDPLRSSGSSGRRRGWSCVGRCPPRSLGARAQRTAVRGSS